jgi:hypothetical protein
VSTAQFGTIGDVVSPLCSAKRNSSFYAENKQFEGYEIRSTCRRVEEERMADPTIGRTMHDFQLVQLPFRCQKSCMNDLIKADDEHGVWYIIILNPWSCKWI